MPSPWDFPYFKAQPHPAVAVASPAAALQSPLRPVTAAVRGASDVHDPPPPMYLDSYFPAAMQLLHYFSERMQYTELHSTTVAPPYTGGDYGVPAGGQAGGGSAGTPAVTTPQTTSIPPSTTSRPTTTTTSNKVAN